MSPNTSEKPTTPGGPINYHSAHRMMSTSMLSDLNRHAKASSPNRSAQQEVDWFRFEYKMRGIIDGLMVPLFTTVNLVKESNDNMVSNVTGLEKAVVEIKDTIKLMDTKIRMFEELPRRFMQVEDRVIMYENRSENLQKAFHNMQHTYQTFTIGVQDKLAVFEKMLDTKGFYEYIQSVMDRFKENLMKEYKLKERERDDHVEGIKDNIAKLEERYNQTLLKAKQMTDLFESSYTQTTSHSMQIEKISENHKKLKSTLVAKLHETKERLDKETLEINS